MIYLCHAERSATRLWRSEASAYLIKTLHFVQSDNLVIGNPHTNSGKQ